MPNDLNSRRVLILAALAAAGAFFVWSLLRDSTSRALAITTLELVAASSLISVPVGAFLAVLFVRTDLPGRGLWRLLLVLQLFVPLYLHAAAWRAGFGVTGVFTHWTKVAGTPVVLLEHWRGAIWTHAVASLPWVVLIVGAGLKFVEPELEEEALLYAGPARVFRRVTLPRALSSICVVLALGRGGYGRRDVGHRSVSHPHVRRRVVHLALARRRPADGLARCVTDGCDGGGRGCGGAAVGRPAGSAGRADKRQAAAGLSLGKMALAAGRRRRGHDDLAGRRSAGQSVLQGRHRNCAHARGAGANVVGLEIRPPDDREPRGVLTRTLLDDPDWRCGGDTHRGAGSGVGLAGARRRLARRRRWPSARRAWRRRALWWPWR